MLGSCDALERMCQLNVVEVIFKVNAIKILSRRQENNNFKIRGGGELHAHCIL